METSLHKLYLYDDIRPLLYSSDSFFCLDTDNAPMNKRNLKAHKGMDNVLKFKVFDPDRKPVKLNGVGDIYARITNPDNGTIVRETRARIGEATGMVFVELNEGDLADIPAGLYKFNVYAQDPFLQSGAGVNEYLSSPFYTDYDSNITYTLEITEQGQRDPIPSQIVLENEWTPFRNLQADNNNTPMQSYYSKTLSGSRSRNHVNGVHSFSVSADNFTGTLEVYGTLLETPSANPTTNEWFRIFLSSIDYVIFMTNYTGTDAFTFSNNVLWLKFIYTPSTEVEDSGTIKKIILR